MMKRLLSLVIMGIILSSTGIVFATNGINGTNEVVAGSVGIWNSLKPMNEARAIFGLVPVDGLLYAVGGCVINTSAYQNMINNLEYYNPTTGNWTLLDKPMNTPRISFAIAAVGRKIYVFGGATAGHTITSAEYYDIDKGTWTTLPQGLNYTRMGMDGGVAPVVNNTIYIMGGWVDSSNWVDRTSNASEAYNTVTGQWVTGLKQLPEHRRNFATAVLDGKIYLIGGIRHQGSWGSPDANVTNVDVYDPKTNSWWGTNNTHPRPADIPNELRGEEMSAAVLNGNIYVFGGDYNWNALNKVWEYSPSNDTWQYVGQLRTPQVIGGGGITTGNQANQAAELDGKIYYVGGSTNDAFSLTPLLKKTEANMLTARQELGLVGINGLLYAMGGDDSLGGGPHETNIIEVYNTTTNVWTTSKITLPTPSRAFAYAAVGDEIYCFGGATDSTSNRAIKINPKTMTSWVDLTSIPGMSRCFQNGGEAPVINGVIYLFGGYSTDRPGGDRILNEALAYNTTSGNWITLPNMPNNRHCNSVVAIGSLIYLIGGYNDDPGKLYYGALPNVDVFDTSTNKWLPQNDSRVLPPLPTTSPDGTLALGLCTSAFVLNGNIYVIGGETRFDAGANPLKTIWVYVPGSTSWSAVGSLKSDNVRTRAAVSVFNDTAYFIGGGIPPSDFPKVSLNEAYSLNLPSTEISLNGIKGNHDWWASNVEVSLQTKWQQETSLPRPLWGFSSVVHNDTLYIFGGQDQSYISDKVYYTRLDGLTLDWKETQKLPENRTWYVNAAVVQNDYVYLVAGWGTQPTNTVFYSKINGNGTLGNWTTSDKPLGIDQGSYVTAFNNRLYVVSGPSGSIYCADLDPTTGALGNWVPVNDPFYGNVGYDSAGAMYNGTIYISGGENGWGGVNNKTAYGIITDNGITWSNGHNLPIPLGRSDTAAINGEFFLVGGYTTDNYPKYSTNTTWVTKIQSDKNLGDWKELISLPEKINQHRIIVYGNKLYVIGGQDEQTNTIDKVYSSDLTASVYYKLDDSSWAIYTGPITVTQEGKNTLQYYSIDTQGNTEQIQTQEVDHKTPPTITV